MRTLKFHNNTKTFFSRFIEKTQREFIQITFGDSCENSSPHSANKTGQREDQETPKYFFFNSNFRTRSLTPPLAAMSRNQLRKKKKLDKCGTFSASLSRLSCALFFSLCLL